MSKKFSKTRKISRKQRSKRNKKTRSNRKRGGGIMDKLYSEATQKFNEKDVMEQDKIKDAIDNLSKLGKNVPGSEGEENPYNLDNYNSKEELLDASEKIKQTKIMYIKSKGTSEYNKYGVKDTTKQKDCINLCKELGVVKRKRPTSGLQQYFSTYETDTTCNEICDPN